MIKNLDWISFSAFNKGKDIISSDQDYVVVKSGIKTKHFNALYEVFFKHDRIAIITAEPNSKILKPELVIVKIENKYLYAGDIDRQVGYLCSSLFLQLNNWSRIDICIDFTELLYIIDPHKLICDFITGKILHRNKGEYTIHGKHNILNKHETITFGTNKTAVKTTLYNKSKYMATKVNKPWIIERWKESGINIDKTVWRLEFSIKDFGMKIVDKESGEMTPIKSLKKATDFLQESIVAMLIDNYFRFVINDGKSRKDRMEVIRLFNIIKSNLKLIKVVDYSEGTRADKVLIKQLTKTYSELREYRVKERVESMNVRKQIIKDKGLEKWYEERIVYWT